MNSETSTDHSLHFILARRSIRVFKDGRVSREQIRRLLEAAMAAPSAVAKDPWRFVVIQERSTLEKLAPALSNGEMLLRAGTGIAVCGDLEAAHDRQLSYLLQDCAAAVENLLLAAHGLGLGACWLGVHPREQRISALKTTLHLPPSFVPVACVAVGFPGERKAPRTRYNEQFVRWEKWG